ncbi:MAG: PQQ-dependent sugar dehydrogenase [Hyphomonadaceae bacterium]|nr:PQQ-dependent sugar dehydrogenase [Hyphomonadaceae bacterium]
MSNSLRAPAHLVLNAVRYLTIKDTSGRPRWLWTGCLLVLAGLIASAAFVGGALFHGTPSFNKLKTRVQMALSVQTVDPVDTWNLVDSDEITLDWRPLESNNLSLERLTFPLASFPGSGGSITEVDGLLVIVTPKGRVGYISGLTEDATHGAVTYTDMQVPMRLPEFEASEMAKTPGFNRVWLRTLDSVVRPIADGRYELFVSHHRYDDECLREVVSQTVVHAGPNGLQQDSDAEWQQVFQSNPCLELKLTGNLYSGMRDGGRMAFQPDGKLLLTVGDFDFDGDNSPINAPMDLEQSYGKVHELDLEAGTSQIFAYGMRNPQGLTVTHDGHVFTTEHGPNGGDEVNHILRDTNYGWPEVTYGMGYGFPRRPWDSNPVQGQHEGPDYALPAFAYVPSIGIGALLEITSPSFPEWHGDLLVSSLDAQTLFRLRRDGARIIYSEDIHIGERMRDSLQLSSGMLAFLTDSAHVILIRPKPPAPLDDKTIEVPSLTLAGYDGVRAIAKEQAATFAALGIHPGSVVFNSKCASCHALDTDETVVGPSLLHIAGRRIGGVEGYPYSEALSGRSERWTERRLQRFLSDPERNYPGTNMGRVPLTYPEYLHVSWWLTNCTGGRDRPECHTDG